MNSIREFARTRAKAVRRSLSDVMAHGLMFGCVPRRYRIKPMLRAAAKSLLKLLFVTGLVAGGTVGAWYYEHRQSAAYQIQQLEKQRKQLEEEKQQLQTVVKRLS